MQQAFKNNINDNPVEWDYKKHTIADEQTDAFGELRFENSNRTDAKVKTILILNLIENFSLKSI